VRDLPRLAQRPGPGGRVEANISRGLTGGHGCSLPFLLTNPIMRLLSVTFINNGDTGKAEAQSRFDGKEVNNEYR